MSASDECNTELQIEPEDGYEIVGPHGLQRFGKGTNDRLLRLDEALYWLAHTKEHPRKGSVYAIFSPLVQWDEADPSYRRQVLYLINGEDYAYPLSLGDRLNPAALDVWGDMPFSNGDSYSMGTVREIAELWETSWPGFAADAEPFYRAGWVEYCKAMKRVAKASELPHLWEEKYRNDYYINLGEWKERCKRFVRSFSRLAVPIAVAHELWGWGKAVAVVASIAAPAVPITANDVNDWPSLVRYRLGTALQVGAEIQKRPAWSSEHVAILAARLQQECREGRGKGALGRLAKELGTSRQALIGSQKPDGKPGPLVRHGYSVTTGLKLATPFDGLGVSKKEA